MKRKRTSPDLPAPIGGLPALAANLWWSWSLEARELFRAIDPLLWRETRHNPISLLERADPARLAACAADPEFVVRYERIVNELRHARTREGTWFARLFPEERNRPVAYFCAEFGLHNSVPIYSGGLGVLAGDHCKAASDLGIPLVAVGLFYTKGFFDQRIRLDGWQEDSDDRVDPSQAPLLPVLDEAGNPHLVAVETAERQIHVGAWRLEVGAVTVYLLDTDLDSNHAEDRALSHKLYAGGQEVRLRQEWLLGVGGVRLLRRLGIAPAAWHANEGHVGFMFIERLREHLGAGLPLQEAVSAVRTASVFTTHTPVPAGHDAFTQEQIEGCLGPVWEAMGITRDEFLGLGVHPTSDHEQFHMTALCLRMAGRATGVSALHGKESRKIWQPLWPDRAEESVPIGHVTNGVHLATWTARQVLRLLEEHLGEGWDRERDSAELWERVLGLDDARLWAVHEELKAGLLDFMREDARQRWRDDWKESGYLPAAGVFFNPSALTIGFARRFATYKRADLIFTDPDRLRRILADPRRPVQIVFTGKAHPADEPAKRLLQRIYAFAREPSFEGRVAFLEDYELHLAHRLVQGCDLWLNVPRVPLEASGTSGMKAALNGVPQLGTLDGWFAEGFTGSNGWAIPRAEKGDVDAHDADHLYRLLETEVVPLYYDRDERGIPAGWVAKMKHSIKEAGARFTARTMLSHYARDYYAPAMRGEPDGGTPTG